MLNNHRNCVLTFHIQHPKSKRENKEMRKARANDRNPLVDGLLELLFVEELQNQENQLPTERRHRITLAAGSKP